MQQIRHAIFVEFDPRKVQPLAALEAFYLVKESEVKCVVLSFLGDTWRRHPYELFVPPGGALDKLRGIAQAASRRVAAQLQAGADRLQTPTRGAYFTFRVGKDRLAPRSLPLRPSRLRLID